MPQTLYILTNTGQSEKEDFVNYIHEESNKGDLHVSVVFVEDQPNPQGINIENMYMIQQDESTLLKDTKLKPISYQDLVRLIFASDSVSVI